MKHFKYLISAGKLFMTGWNRKKSPVKEEKKRLIWIDSDSGQTEVSPPKHTNTHTNKQLDDLKEQLDYFRKQTEILQSQLTEQSQRHDTIVTKLSNTIENQQLLLQEAQNHVPFWEKMFGLAVRSNGNYSLKTCAVTAPYSRCFRSLWHLATWSTSRLNDFS